MSLNTEKVKKTDIVREAYKCGDIKKALRIAKEFKIGISEEEQDKMKMAYECIVHPDFYKMLGRDIETIIVEGQFVLKEKVI